MSKTLEDYRQIVKVLKLQLLKIRQENSSLSKTLGIATQSQSSSFTPRLDKLRNSNKEFAKHLSLFNLFAHRCQIIGISPQMVFRIADKKRDKKVAISDLTQIIKRLKLKLDDVQISRILGSITKSDNVYYDQYVQYINAFQINSEVYPPKSQRTYSQICMIKLGVEAKQKNISIQNLFRQISNKDGGPFISFQGFRNYCKNNTKLKDSEIICIFVALDPQSDCQIDKDIFMRQMNKVSYLVQKGINLQEQQSQRPKKSKIKQTKQTRERQNKDNKDFEMEEQTGVEKGNQVVKKQGKKQAKLLKGDMNKLIQQLKKQGISANNLITKIIQKQQTRKLVRPFNLNQFSKYLTLINKTIDKKKTLQYFKCLDTSGNGSISTDELIKLWLGGKQSLDSSQILFKLISRHLKQVQSQSFINKFSTLGYQKQDVITTNMLSDVFSGLSLQQDYIKQIQSYLPTKCSVQKFVQILQTGGAKKSKKQFVPMKKADYQQLNSMIKKLVPKQPKRFVKLTRQEANDKGDTIKQQWQTIFTDEWSCWNQCLQTAYKLKSSWRDPQFGPNAGDPNGYRSIVGNQSQPPRGLPFQDQIQWITFQQMLQKQGKKLQDVKLFSDNLIANDIIQGKLGDCWYVSALSIITSNDEFVKGKSLKQAKIDPQNALTYGIHPIIFHYFRQFGIYVFKFFKSFKPVYVMVDDLFPIQKSSNDLIFAKSPTPGLQWVAFLQKAYAKLHHCYSNMISGDISQGLADLTNALPIKQNLVNNNPQQLALKMSKLMVQSQLMGCSINVPPNSGTEQPVTLDDQRTGLFYGHAYSIGDFIDLNSISKQDFKLMRVRNPWGHGEWMLDWSDNPLNKDPDYMKLSKYQKDLDKFYENKIARAKQNGQNFNEITKYQPGDDGQFLMNFNDFAKIYSNLFVGYNLKGKDYTLYTLQGKWDKATPSGLCKAKGATDQQKTKFIKDNYQFILQVKQKTDVIMFLIQPDGRLYRGQKYPYKQVCNGIIILSFNLDKGEKMLQKFDNNKLTLPTLKLQIKRQANYWHKFQPGNYAIVPCKMQNKIPETKFQFRVYADKPVVIRKVLGQGADFKVELPAKGGQKSKQLNQVVDFIVKNSGQK